MKIHGNPHTGGVPPGHDPDHHGKKAAEQAQFESILNDYIDEQAEQLQKEQEERERQNLERQAKEAQKKAQEAELQEKEQTEAAEQQEAVEEETQNEVEQNEDLETQQYKTKLAAKNTESSQLNQDSYSKKFMGRKPSGGPADSEEAALTTTEGTRHDRGKHLGAAKRQNQTTQQSGQGVGRSRNLNAKISDDSAQNRLNLKAKGMDDSNLPKIDGGAAEQAESAQLPGQTGPAPEGKTANAEFSELVKSDQQGGTPQGLQKKPEGLPPGLQKKPEGLPPGQVEKLNTKRSTEAEQQIGDLSVKTEGKPPNFMGDLLPLSAYLPQDANVNQVNPTAPAAELHISQIEKIVDRIVTGINASGQPELKMELHLPELGQFNVNITRADAGITIAFNTQTEKAGQQLGQNMQALYTALAEKALNISNIQVMIQNQPVPLSELIETYRPNADNRVFRKESSNRAEREREKKQQQQNTSTGPKSIKGA